MKQYFLKVMTYTHVYDKTIFATSFHTTTNNSTTKGYYAFYDHDTLVACYPIDKTIIESIEVVEMDEPKEEIKEYKDVNKDELINDIRKNLIEKGYDILPYCYRDKENEIGFGIMGNNGNNNLMKRFTLTLSEIYKHKP